MGVAERTLRAYHATSTLFLHQEILCGVEFGGKKTGTSTIGVHALDQASMGYHNLVLGRASGQSKIFERSPVRPLRRDSARILGLGDQYFWMVPIGISFHESS